MTRGPRADAEQRIGSAHRAIEIREKRRRGLSSRPAPDDLALQPPSSVHDAAIESGDVAGAIAMLAADVVFRSPVVSEPCRGRDAVAAVLARAGRVFEDFRYVREIGGAGEHDHALLFEARVGDRHVEGCDFLRTADDGSIGEFTVIVRPLSAALALGEAMKAQLAAAEDGLPD